MPNTAKYTVKITANVEPKMKEDVDVIACSFYTNTSTVVHNALREYIERYKAREDSINEFHNTPVDFHKEKVNA